MAKRLLLTLLALFGLAAQLAPAQARVASGAPSAVGGMLLAAPKAGAVAACPATSDRPCASLAHRPEPRAVAPVLAAPPVSPVLIRIDRARE
jgi:hypothetical protein